MMTIPPDPHDQLQQAEHRVRQCVLSLAERTLTQAMLEVEACQHLTAMEWATVFTQCLLSVVLEEVEGHLIEVDEDVC